MSEEVSRQAQEGTKVILYRFVLSMFAFIYVGHMYPILATSIEIYFDDISTQKKNKPPYKGYFDVPYHPSWYIEISFY